MLYSFEIQYFEQINQFELVVPIIMDLPQATIQEVRLNPFVIDLVNLPFIKAGIEGFPNHEVSLVDNIHLYSLPTIPSAATSITCRYQEAPGRSDYKTFEFKVFAVIPMNCYFPQSEFIFTCRHLFDAYEQLFQSRRFVTAPDIPNPHYGVSQTTPIRLTDQLMTLVGFSYLNDASIKALSSVNCFIGEATDIFNTKIQVFIKRKSFGYSLIVPDPAANSGCRLERFFYLQELQYILSKELKATINITHAQMASVNQHITDTEHLAKIISEIPVVIDAYNAQNNSQKPSRQQTITYVGKHFNISFNDAQRIMVMMHY